MYLVLSSAFSVGLHPLGARWIQEHYIIKPGQETYSYYGPYNWVSYNVGYHNEHHDLMVVPWSRLPKLREMAPEFYNNLYYHTSYTSLLLRFLFDRSLTLHSRAVREIRPETIDRFDRKSAEATSAAAVVEPELATT
jgi:sphingolipid delta-4 desaturase